MTKCLDVKYLAKALNLLLDEGLVEEEDAEGNAVPNALPFADSDALYAHADKLVRELQDAPRTAVQPQPPHLPRVAAWTYQHRSAREAEISWFHDLTLGTAGSV